MFDHDIITELARLDAECLVTNDQAEQREAELSGLLARRAQLEQRLSKDQAEAIPENDVSDLVDLLLDNPDAALPKDGLITTRDRSGARDAQAAIISAALATLDRRIVDAEQTLADARSAAAGAWRTFVTRAYDHLLAEFRARFLTLRDEILSPLTALAETRELDSSARVIGGAPKLDESRIVIRRYGSPIVTDALFDTRAREGQAGHIRTDGAIDRLRVQLSNFALENEALAPPRRVKAAA